jgi:hypothetical protein
MQSIKLFMMDIVVSSGGVRVLVPIPSLKVIILIRYVFIFTDRLSYNNIC